MSSSGLVSARETLIECCRNTREGILECVDWFRTSSHSFYEKVTAQFNGVDTEHTNKVTSRDQPFIAGRIQSIRGSGMPTGRPFADRIQSRRRSEIPKGRSCADRIQSRRRNEIPTGLRKGSCGHDQSMTSRLADSSVTTKSDKASLQSLPEQHTTRLRANSFPSRHHGHLKSMKFRKIKKQTLDMFTTKHSNNHNCVTGQSGPFPSNMATSLIEMQSHKDTSADEIRERSSTMPSLRSRIAYTNEQSRKCNGSVSFNCGLNKSTQGGKTNKAKYLFSKFMSKQKSTDETIKHPKYEPDSFNRISEISFLKDKSAMRRTKSVQNEEPVAYNTSYNASTLMFGDVKLTSVEPKKKRDPCKDAGYDPSTLVPSVSYYSNDAAEEHEPHFQTLKSILQQIQSSQSVEEIAFNKVKALCHKRKQ